MNVSEKVFIYREAVPVDGQWHKLEVGEVLHVASRKTGIVEVWYFSDDARITIEYRVFGTGEEVPRNAQYEGTCFDGGTNTLVWHLFSRKAGAP